MSYINNMELDFKEEFISKYKSEEEWLEIFYKKKISIFIVDISEFNDII